jgi:hypothetical protein
MGIEEWEGRAVGKAERWRREPAPSGGRAGCFFYSPASSAPLLAGFKSSVVLLASRAAKSDAGSPSPSSPVAGVED